MQITKVLFSQTVAQARTLPTKTKVSLAYQLHMPNKTVNPNLAIRSHEPIVFLHGIFGSKNNYKDYCQTIANTTHTPVYALDFRNHGESEHCFPLINYQTLSQDVVDFCEEHDLKKVSIVGYSLGAKVGLLTMLKHPELVSSGVIIGNSPAKTPQVKVYLKVFLKAMTELINSAHIKASDKNWRSKANAVLHKFIPDGNIVQYLLRNVINRNSSHIPGHTDLITVRMPVGHFDKKVVDEIADWPEDEVKGLKFEGPVKVIKGAKSAFIDQDGLKAYKEHFPNYTMATLNTDHLIFAEMPLRVTKIICDFFKLTRYQTLQMHTRDGENHTVQKLRTETEKGFDLKFENNQSEVRAQL
jgi:pimeloyl-ACP methyl ester carboxylesterase